MNNLGIVIIGRNEGERLWNCLNSLPCDLNKKSVIYVDSGSIDKSVELAQTLGYSTLSLDLTTPCSAARARNEGFTFLIQNHPDVHYVQFIDGDCELCDGWLGEALFYFSQYDLCSVVAGRTIEKFPDISVYNLLCDLEWGSPAGIVSSCGGIFMARTDSFLQVEGFNSTILAGEEPELCYRLRNLGFEIHRLDIPMVLHDASMTKFSQWWKRSMRSGLAYAQGFSLHGKDKGNFCLKDLLRIWLWAFFLPLGILSLATIYSPWNLSLLAIYPCQILRIAISANARFTNAKKSLLYAFFNMLGKFPQFLGQMSFWMSKFLKKNSQLIEYK